MLLRQVADRYDGRAAALMPSNETRTEPYYPDVEVELTDGDGNAMSIMGSVRRGLRRAGVAQSEIDTFTAEAMSGDYDNVLVTAMRWVDVS